MTSSDSRHTRDRFLLEKNGRYLYSRRIPADIVPLIQADEGLAKPPGPIRRSLKTNDIHIARLRRDKMAEADELYWESLAAGTADRRAKARYERARLAARMARVTYKTADQLAAEASIEEIVRRVELVEALVAAGQDRRQVSEAILGLVDEPTVSMNGMLKFYFDTISSEKRKSKSPGQWKRFCHSRRRAFRRAAECFGGDLPIARVTREEAKQFRDHLKAKVEAGELKAASADKELIYINAVWKAYHDYIDELDRQSPFKGMRLQRGRVAVRDQRLGKYPPFSAEWIETRLLDPELLRKLNPIARAIFLVQIEMPVRPSEICNLKPERVHLDDTPPWLQIRDEADREVKSESALRDLPLVGIAAEVMQLCPEGFPRYADKENSLSAVINKWLKSNGLKETDRHVFYSLRHGWKDRAIEHEVDEELREVMMGHAVGHIVYGRQGSLAKRYEAVAGMAMPFDRVIVQQLSDDLQALEVRSAAKKTSVGRTSRAGDRT